MVPADAAAPAVPGAPTILSATADIQNAKITFDSPADNGGARVFAYRVTCTSTDGRYTAIRSGKHSPLVVGGLSVGRLYTCRVAARNVAGLGAPSADSPAVIPQLDPHRSVPHAPTKIRVTPLVASIQVSFADSPDRVFGTTTMHRAVCTSSDGGGPSSQRKEHGPPIVVRTLTPNKTYTCFVLSRDQFGWGDASERSAPVVVLPPPPAT